MAEAALGEVGLSRASDARLELGEVTLWPRAGGEGLPPTFPGPSPEAANFSLYFLAAPGGLGSLCSSAPGGWHLCGCQEPGLLSLRGALVVS